MTTEELFAQMEAQAANEKEYCVIDPITREISVPEVYQKIGVVSDEKTNRIYFQCPRIVGDNVDLTKYGIRVNYQNANGQTKPYPVDDVSVSGDNITFSWLLERPVTTYKGTINFVVCAIKTSGEEITNEWNTTLAQAEVLEGLEPDITITEEEESIVELLVAQCTQKLTEMSVAIQNSENATNDAKTATQEAVNATEDARSVIEQITRDSYLHTALETFINEVTATPTAYGNALVEKIEGYIRQGENPSPDYPQVIHGVGDMGFFDGELLQGVYSAGDGSYSSANTSVCNANKIPAKQGDIVRIEYEEGNKNLYIIAYDKSGKFLKAYVESSEKSYLSTEALPANTDYVNFNIQSKETASLPVSSAKHITVTINGMYAICVKSIGKNLFDNKNVVYGKAVNNNSGLIFDSSGYCVSDYIKVKSFSKVYATQMTSGNWMAFYDESLRYVSGYAGNALIPVPQNAVYARFTVLESYLNEFLVVEGGTKPDNYIPYQGKTTYIPISSPLFGGDYLFNQNMVYKTYRKMGFAIFDGSEDEKWTKVSSGENTYYRIELSELNEGKNSTVKCNRFMKANIASGNTLIGCNVFDTSAGDGFCFVLRPGIDSITDENSLKTWLQSNLLVISWEFNTTTEEELSPEAQKAIHSIMSCDEQTTIEIVGVPTDAEVQNQFLLPRNVDGALNTTAYATSKRNEITLSEQAQQLSQVVTQAITLAKAQEV